MADSETTPLIQAPNGDTDRSEEDPLSWHEWCGSKLESRRYHSTILFLIILDSIIVIVEISYLLLLQCTPEGDEHVPTWLEVLLDLSMAISCLFLLEIPAALFAFGPSYYNPWSDITHSTFHLIDAIIIIMNFTILFLQGPAQEVGELLILLRLWRLVKLLGGVATGVEGLNEELRYKLEVAEKELIAKKQELDAAQRTIGDLQRKMNATQP